MCVDCFGVHAAPVDTKLLLWLVSKDALPEGTDIKTAQQVIEKNLKGGDEEDFFHGSRKEIDDWSPKSWPHVAKAHSPILAPPPIEGSATAGPPGTDGKAKAALLLKKPGEPVKKPQPLTIKKK